MSERDDLCENHEVSSSSKASLFFFDGLAVKTESDLENVLDSLSSIKRPYFPGMKMIMRESNCAGKLESLGASMAHLISVCLYVRDMVDYPKLNSLYGRYFELNPPVRVCVQSPVHDYALIEAIATLDFASKQSMHVQSISHWAPANIGPYSQAVQVFLIPVTICISPQIECLFMFR